MGDKNQKKEKMINFWTWFDKNWGSYVEELLEKEEKIRRNDVFIYQLIKYPPNSIPPTKD